MAGSYNGHGAKYWYDRYTELQTQTGLKTIADYEYQGHSAEYWHSLYVAAEGTCSSYQSKIADLRVEIEYLRRIDYGSSDVSTETADYKGHDAKYWHDHLVASEKAFAEEKQNWQTVHDRLLQQVDDLKSLSDTSSRSVALTGIPVSASLTSAEVPATLSSAAPPTSFFAALEDWILHNRLTASILTGIFLFLFVITLGRAGKSSDPNSSGASSITPPSSSVAHSSRLSQSRVYTEEDVSRILGEESNSSVPAAASTQSRTVYWVPKGKSYHYRESCPTLSRSKTILSGTLDEAILAGKDDPCDICAGG